MRTNSWLTQHALAHRLELRLGSVDVRHFVTDMMLPPLRVLFEEACDGSVPRQWLDEFDLPDKGVKVCFVDTPGANGAMDGTQIELIEPLPGNASITAFLQKNPQGGQHHVCYEVPDIHAAKAEFEAMGKRVLGEPRIGAHGTLIFFVHPRDMQGVLTEIMEVPAGNGH